MAKSSSSSRSNKEIELIAEKIPHKETADKFWRILSKLFHRGWIVDVKATYDKVNEYKKLYVCINIEKYDLLARVTKVSGWLVNAYVKKEGYSLGEWEIKEKYDLSALIAEERLKNWLDVYDVTTLFLIDGAYPYQDNSDCYYSAKTKQLFYTQEPPTRTTDPEDGEYLINPCVIFGKNKIVNKPHSSITLKFDKYKYGELFVTHCFDTLRKKGKTYSNELDMELSESQKSIAESIYSCGGLINTSLAISELPATQFGFNVMVLNTELIKGWFDKRPAVKMTLPYYIYSSDGWTGTSVEYFGSLSKRLYNEYFDGFDLMYYKLGAYGSQNIEIEDGRYVEVDDHFGEGISVIQSEIQLVRALNHKKKIMDKAIKYMSNKGTDNELFRKYFDGLSAHEKYWLCEIKFSKVLDINCFMMCICPDYMYKNTKMFLDKIGFTGKIIPLKLSDELRSKMMDSGYMPKYDIEYSLLVREKILELSKSGEHLRIVENGKSTKRTDEKLWQKIVEEVKMGEKGGKSGQWSARKAQLAVKLYKDSGGGYIGEKESDNSLVKWTEQKWRTKSGEKSSVTGERYLPEKAIKALSDKEYRLTSSIKRKGTRMGQQFVKQPTNIAKKVAKYRK
jgi:hypothetical protein